MFISFEGIDGSGKSTQEMRLAAYLAEKGFTVHQVREPGGTPISESIRALLLDPASEIDPFAEMLLFSAARAELTRTCIRDWRAAGDWIICDRFLDSTVAYQGGGRGIGNPEWLMQFQKTVTDGMVPDRTYYMRIDLETAAHRRTKRDGDTGDRMERAGDEFYARVLATYDSIAKNEPERILVLDGTLPPDDIFRRIRDDVDALLKRNSVNAAR